MFRTLTIAFRSLRRLLKTDAEVQRLYTFDRGVAEINICILNLWFILEFLDRGL